jgi:phospholipase/carboxylesterase
MLESVEQTVGAEPEQSVIWLHGLGADGHDFEPIVPELNLRTATRFVFPHADVRPVTLNNGMAMRAWFDILSLDRTGTVDTAGIESSCDAVDALVEREVERGIPRHRIVIAGFSQGGAIAMHVALRAKTPFAGLVVLSSYLPLAERLNDYPMTPLPLFLAHGTYDPVLPLAMGEATRQVLTAAGLDPEWHTYPMAHGVSPPEIADLAAWFGRLGA